MTKTIEKSNFEAMKKLNKVIFDKYDPDSLNNKYVTKKWNSGKVNYIQHYFNQMLRNDDFGTAKQLLNTKSLGKALQLVEYYNNEPYNSFTWPNNETKVEWNEENK